MPLLSGPVHAQAEPCLTSAAPCLPSPQSFELESCERLRRLPPELSALTGLQQLRISHQRLEQLPQVVAGLSQVCGMLCWTALLSAACCVEA